LPFRDFDTELLEQDGQVLEGLHTDRLMFEHAVRHVEQACLCIFALGVLAILHDDRSQEHREVSQGKLIVDLETFFEPPKKLLAIGKRRRKRTAVLSDKELQGLVNVGIDKVHLDILNTQANEFHWLLADNAETKTGQAHLDRHNRLLGERLENSKKKKKSNLALTDDCTIFARFIDALIVLLGRAASRLENALYRGDGFAVFSNDSLACKAHDDSGRLGEHVDLHLVLALAWKQNEQVSFKPSCAYWM